jgi:hypothetical protein
MEKELIGKIKEEAIALLKENNSKYRISMEDGEHFMLTMDFNPTRYNLHIMDGIITEVSMG